MDKSALRVRPLRRLLFVRALKRAHTIYALGEYTRSLLNSLSINDRIILKPPRIAIDKAVTLQSIRDSFTKKQTAPFALLSIGRLVEHKGHSVLVDALNQIKNDDRWRLTIIGSGPCALPLMQQIDRYNLSGRISILQNATDDTVHNELKRAALFIHPSRETGRGTEGFGIVLLEAMAHGVPVIASSCGGIPAVLNSGSCGALVPPDDPLALARSISLLIDDPLDQLRLALAGFEYVHKNYSRNIDQ